MALSLPNGRSVFIPQIPQEIEDAAVKKYLTTLRVELETQFRKAWENANMAVNTGTTGTITITAGTTVTIESGLITAITPP